jgi:fructokinase
MNNPAASGNSLRPVIFGEVLFDRFPDGSAVLGGAPFNVAWHLQAFGLEPLFISSVGTDPLGSRIRAAMQGWGMDLSGLQTDPHHPTGVVDVSFHKGEPHYLIVPDSAWDFIQPELLPDLPANALLYHGSLALRQPVSRNAWQGLLQTAGQQRFIDINLRAPWWDAANIADLLAGAHFLKLNADELAEMVPQASDTDSRIHHLFDTLPLEWLVVTQGAAGALAISATGERLQVKPEQATQVVDTVGAGDAFSSVLLLGQVKGWAMAQTLQRAQQFASAVVGLRGATTPDREFYQAFMAL